MNIDEFIRASIRRNEEEAKQLIMKKKQERITELLQKSGLGKRFQGKTFDNFQVNDKNRAAFISAREFCVNFPNNRRGLLIIGPVGTGKTHLASAITNELIGKLYTVMCRNITDIISMIKSTYGQKSDLEEQEIVDILTKEVDLLVIDDLGKENASENTRKLLYQIINRLYDDDRPIVVTTNYTSDALEHRLGERGEAIVSRLTEMCEPVITSGQDWRLKP